MCVMFKCLDKGLNSLLFSQQSYVTYTYNFTDNMGVAICLNGLLNHRYLYSLCKSLTLSYVIKYIVSHVDLHSGTLQVKKLFS